MKNKEITKQTLVYQAKDGAIEMKFNCKKVVSSKMETTTPRQVIVSNTRFINWSAQKMHIPTVSILETVQAKKSH